MEIDSLNFRKLSLVIGIALICAGVLAYELPGMSPKPTQPVVVIDSPPGGTQVKVGNANGFYGHNIATALSRGESFGQAILGHVNVPLRHPWSENREEHFAEQVILGDPTLGLQP